VVLVLTYEARAVRKNHSLASSITKLGIVRFVIPERPILPHEDARTSGGVVELPSFTSEPSPRPTVQMPPLSPRRELPLDTQRACDPEPEELAPPPQHVWIPTMLGMMRMP